MFFGQLCMLEQREPNHARFMSTQITAADQGPLLSSTYEEWSQVEGYIGFGPFVNPLSDIPDTPHAKSIKVIAHRFL